VDLEKLRDQREDGLPPFQRLADTCTPGRGHKNHTQPSRMAHISSPLLAGSFGTTAGRVKKPTRQTIGHHNGPGCRGAGEFPPRTGPPPPPFRRASTRSYAAVLTLSTKTWARAAGWRASPLGTQSAARGTRGTGRPSGRSSSTRRQLRVQHE